MGEKKVEEWLPLQDEVSSSDTVTKLIRNGTYRVVYDGNGVQSNPSGPRSNLTWYAFDIIDQDNHTIGEYHIHPDQRKRCGFASGNLRLFYKRVSPGRGKLPPSESKQSAAILTAPKWQWLCDEVCDQV
ncbi:MAG: hypothetical protein J5I93_14320 [Pirellulaceae bacterium]|nr:hypothetical protein [Pirellulaceae bacterium]